MGPHGYRSVTAVNMGLPHEWYGRIYLFDIGQTGGLERSLHFLEGLTEHVTPALTTVFLFRRLRARAGAVERARVARELHDGAIQALFGIEMKIEALRRAQDPSSAQIETELGEVQGLLHTEVMALRELMQALRPIEVDGSEQLTDILAGLVDRFRRDTGISAHFVATSGPVTLPPPRALEIRLSSLAPPSAHESQRPRSRRRSRRVIHGGATIGYRTKVGGAGINRPWRRDVSTTDNRQLTGVRCRHD